jgi:hypothetical protein
MASPASSVGSYEPFPSSSSESEGRSLDELHDLLAPTYWDEQNWDFFARSEDDEPPTDDEDLDVLLGKDLPDDDLSDYSWEGDEDAESEDSENSDEDSPKRLLHDEEEDKELVDLFGDDDPADGERACSRCQGLCGNSDDDDGGGDGDNSDSDSGGDDAMIALPPVKRCCYKA